MLNLEAIRAIARRIADGTATPLDYVEAYALVAQAAVATLAGSCS